jgi:hypothetical protein
VGRQRFPICGDAERIDDCLLEGVEFIVHWLHLRARL